MDDALLRACFEHGLIQEAPVITSRVVPDLPPAPHGAPVHEARSSVSSLELRRLLALASASACVSLAAGAGAAGASAGWASEEDEEDPGTPLAAAPFRRGAAGTERLARSSVSATVCVARGGYAVVRVEYDDEVRFSPSTGDASSCRLDLPGPLRATLAVSGGSVDLASGLARRSARAPLGASSPSGAPVFSHFCAPLGLSVRALDEKGAELAAAACSLVWGSGGEALSLVLPAEQQCASLLLRRSYAWSCANDGHTLCVALPVLPPGEGTPGHTPVACSRAVCDSLLLDPLLCGVASVVCPTHSLLVRGLGTARASAVCELLGGASEGAAAAAQLQAPVLLIEPGNCATVWSSLCLAPDGGAPLGLVAWLRERQGGAGSCADADAGGAPAERAPSPAPAPVVLADSLPEHIAVIMDGNGRWAQRRGLSRGAGHVAGVEAIHGIIRACRRLRVPYLTLYAFSAQNWSRPEDEVRALMRLLGDFVRSDLEELCANGVRLLVAGDMARLPKAVRVGLARMIERSAGNAGGLTLRLALSYGGREEICAAAVGACRAAQAGLLDPATLTPEAFRAFLPHPDVPDPDLLVRTSGELRVSNFLLWQIAYTELYATPVLWPDFGDADVAAALVAYAARERRFGKTSAQVARTGARPVDEALLCKARASGGARAASAASGGGGAGAARHGGDAWGESSALSFLGRGVSGALYEVAFAASAWCGSGGRGGHHSDGSSGLRRACGVALCLAFTGVAAVVFVLVALVVATLALKLGLATQAGGSAASASGGGGTCTLVLDSTFLESIVRVLKRALLGSA